MRPNDCAAVRHQTAGSMVLPLYPSPDPTRYIRVSGNPTGHLPGSAHVPPVLRATWGGPAPRGGGRAHVQWGVRASSASTGATLHSAGRVTACCGGPVSTSYELLVGIDWATEAHQVCVLTPEGAVFLERTVEHNAAAIHAFLEALL